LSSIHRLRRQCSGKTPWNKMYWAILLTNARYHYFSIQPIYIHSFGHLKAENMINARASLESG
jgi:hypothetical protein